VNKLFSTLAFAMFLLWTRDVAAEQLQAPIVACDRYSNIAHEYYKSRRDVDGPKEIARATLRTYPDARALSELRLTTGVSDQTLLGVTKRYTGTAGNKSPAIGRRWRGDDYVMMLIPPRLAGQHLGQKRVDDDDSARFLDLPAFLAVPSETFFKGVCRSGGTPMLISSLDSVADEGISHFVLSESDLKTLVSSLFLDPRSSDLAALAAYYDQNFVDASRWQGWITIKIQGRSRTVFHRIFRSRWGLPATIPGSGESDLAYSDIGLTDLAGEMTRIKTGWKDELHGFRDTIAVAVDGINELERSMSQPDFDADSFDIKATKITETLTNSRTEVTRARDRMRSEEDLFMTGTEIDFLTDVMAKTVDKLGSRLNGLSVRYNRMALEDPFDEKIFLNPLAVEVDRLVVKPLPIADRPLPVPGYAGALPLRARGFLMPGEAPGTFSVNMRALIDMESAYQALRNEVHRQAHAAESCSKQIRRINDSTMGVRNGDSYERPIDIEIQIRTCVTFDYPAICGKFPKYKKCTKTHRVITDAARTTARATVSFEVKPLAKDVVIAYGYSVCAFGWICASDRDELASLRALLAQETPNVEKWMSDYDAQFRLVGIRESRRSKKVFLAAHLQTGDLPADKAILILRALGGLQ
jgi:hypothetical protein